MHDLDTNSPNHKNQLNKTVESKTDFNSNKIFGRFSIPLAHKLGSVIASVVLSELIDQYIDTKNINGLNFEIKEEISWCFLDRKLLEKNTAIPNVEQEKALTLLTAKSLIQFSRLGRDGVLHFRPSPNLLHNSKEFS